MKKPSKKPERSSEIVGDRRKLGLVGMSRKPRPSAAGWQVDAAIEQARIDLLEGKCYILGAGMPDPPTHTKEGKPTHEVEVYLRSDGRWRIVRDEKGEVVYAYKPSGKAIKRLSHEIKNQIVYRVLSGFGLYHTLFLLSQEHGYTIAKRDYYREVKLDEDFAARMEIAMRAPRERLLSQVYEMAINHDNLAAAALWFGADDRNRNYENTVTMGRKNFKLKREETHARVKALGGAGPEEGRPEFSVFSKEEFDKFKNLYEKSQTGTHLSPAEAEELGRLTAKAIGPEAARKRARHVAMVDGTLGQGDED